MSIYGLVIPAPLVQDPEPDHVAAKLLLVEVPLGAQAEPAEQESSARTSWSWWWRWRWRAPRPKSRCSLELELAARPAGLLLGGRAGRPRPEPRASQTSRTTPLIGSRMRRPGVSFRWSQGTDGAAVGEVKCHTPGGGSYAHRGTESRLTACCKPGSLTTLRRGVNVSWAAGPRGGGAVAPVRGLKSFLLPPAPLPRCPTDDNAPISHCDGFGPLCLRRPKQ